MNAARGALHTRLSRDAGRGDRAYAARARRARPARRRDDARRGAGRPLERRVPLGRLPHGLPRRGRGAPAGARGAMSDGYVLREDGGSIDVTAGALAQIVQRAVESVEGARVRRPRRGLDLRLEDGRVRVELELAVRYGVVLPEAARDVQARVAEALEAMVDLDVEAVGVSVEG